MKTDRARVSTTVFMRANRARADLVYPYDSTTTNPAEPEEVVLSLQGYLVQSDLPPIYTPHRYILFLSKNL